MGKVFKILKHQMNSFEKCRTIWHQTGGTEVREISGEERRETEAHRLLIENCILLGTNSSKVQQAGRKQAQDCPDAWAQSKPAIQSVRTLNIATEVGTFAGQNPNHEPSRNCPFCGYIATVNVNLINLQEEKYDQQHTHLS